MPYKNKEDRRKHDENNREKIRDYQKEYRKSNPERIKEYQRKYNEKHPYCEWSDDKKKIKRDRVTTYRKNMLEHNPDKFNDSRKKSAKNDYEKNKEKRIKKCIENATEYKKKFREYKKSLSCETCGITGEECPEILSFHHTIQENKKNSISNMVPMGFPSEVISEELKKCKCLCENCHRIEHYNKRKPLSERKLSSSLKSNILWMENYIQHCSCQICGNDDYRCIDFHHILPEMKKYKISNLYARGASVKTIIKELEKCVCVCSNCHKKIHYLETYKYKNGYDVYYEQK